MTYFQQFFFADIPYLKLELSTWIWRSLLAVHMIRGISRVFFMAFPWQNNNYFQKSAQN